MLKIEERRSDLPINERATEDLIGSALGCESEEEMYWDIVTELHKRGSDNELELALQLCDEPDTDVRVLGVDILSQLGCYQVPNRPFKEKVLPLLLGMIEDSANQETGILTSLVAALGHQEDERTAAVIARFKNHPDDMLRWHVATSLGGLESNLAVTTLIELSRDKEPIVRDWATFGLGTQCSLDTPEIRAALIARLDDEDTQARNEAIRGLVQREDERAIPALVRELEAEEPHEQAIETACSLADSPLLPGLIRIRDAKASLGEATEGLDAANEGCRPKSKGGE